MRTWNANQPIRDTPDVLTLSAIRKFFAKRKFARPPDWPTICTMTPARTPMTPERQRELSLWIDGYLAARDKYPSTEDVP